jgi:hypothetical protein
MTNAPERIWVGVSELGDLAINHKGEKLNGYDHVEYTRTDLIPAMIEEAVQAEREAIAVMFDEIAKDEDALSDNYRGGSNPWLRHIHSAKRHRANAAAIRARKGGEA